MTLELSDILIQLNSDDKWVRQKAVENLSGIDDSRVIPALVKSLYDTELPVRIAAVKGLESVCDPTTVPELIKALKDLDRDIYDEAIYALREIAEQGHHLPELHDLLKSDDLLLRQAAAYALGD